MIGRKSLLIILSRFASAGLAFVGLFFMTRYYAADVYGSLAWTLAFVSTFNSFADLGFTSAHIKRVSEGKNINDCLSTFTVAKIMLTSVMVLIILSSILAWSLASGETFSGQSLELILLFILYTVFYDLATIATATFDARVETAKTQISMFMDPIVRVPLIALLSINRVGTTQLAYAYVLGGLMVAVVGLLLLSRGRFAFVRPTLFRSYLKFAFPIALIAVMAAVSANADKLLIGLFWTDADVGYYTASQSTLGLFAVIGTSVSTLAFPTFSRMHTEGRMFEVRAKTRQAERYISMLSMPIVALVLLFPGEIALILLGDNFTGAAGPLRFLSISMLLNLLNGVYASQINAVDRPDLTAKLTLLSLVVNISLLLVFVPTSIFDLNLLGLGATGAAIANVLGVTVIFVATRIIVKKLTRTGSNPRILIHVVAGIVTGGVLFGVGMFWPMLRFYDLIGYGLISAGVFALVLYLIGELRKEDVRFFMSVINPTGMKDYLSSELKKKP